jgi:hypothetical protein
MKANGPVGQSLSGMMLGLEANKVQYLAFWAREQYTEPMFTPSSTPKLSSTQIGTIGENLLVNAVMKASNGRLSPFQPLADDDGLDVLFFDKETGNSVAIQLKCRRNTDRKSNSKGRGNTAQFDVRRATFKEARSAYLVAALFNEPMNDFVCTWFISFEKLSEISNLKSNKYVITPSKAADCGDKYVKYRCQTSEQLADRIIKECESSPKRKKLITAT